MNPLFSLMGGVAKASGRMSRFSINMIPSNWMLIAACFVAVRLFAEEYQLHHETSTVMIIALFVLVALAFVASSLLRHTIFQKGSSPSVAAPSNFGSSPTSGGAFEVPLRWTGKLRLHEKCAQRFLDVPAGLTRLDDGQLAFVSRIDASSRLYGSVVNSKSGVWLSILSPDALEVEDGALYHGFKGAPSLRLRYVDGSDGKPAQNIITFDSIQDRDTMRAALEAERLRCGVKQQPFAPVAA